MLFTCAKNFRKMKCEKLPRIIHYNDMPRNEVKMKAYYLCYPLDQTVIGICSLVCARQALKPLIFGYPAKQNINKLINKISSSRPCSFIFSSLYLSATLYFIPSFSISAITQSVIHGIPGLDTIAEGKRMIRNVFESL